MKNDIEPLGIPIDTFLVDLNGIFHYCAQHAFRYGNFKPKEPSMRKMGYKQQFTRMLDELGLYIFQLIQFTQPQKRVVLCVDGVAPVSKQFQQRQRRFKSAGERKDEDFDSNCITPGTSFLDKVSSYLEWYIRLKLTQEECFQHLEIIFSDEKNPGEGEHKLVKFVREYGKENEQFMIHGMDADLIMLALASNKENFHILRENPYRQSGPEKEFFYIDMKGIRETLVHVLVGEPTLTPDQHIINDFILLMFMSGNDFLPSLPTIDILEGAVDNFFTIYSNTFLSYGTIVTSIHTINLKSLSVIMGTLGAREVEFLTDKRGKLPDALLEKHTKFLGDSYVLDFDAYRLEYYSLKMGCHTEKDIEKACLLYIQGMQWVLSYYLEGVSCWKWFYPYFYAPFISDISKYTEKGGKTDKVVTDSKPNDPFFQLLCVLPPKSSELLPSPLNELFHNQKLACFFPVEFEIDMDGKRNDWEGIVKLPMLDLPLLHQEYKKKVTDVQKRDSFRNKKGNCYVFSYHKNEYYYKSYYGDIPTCHVCVKTIRL